MLFAFWQRVRTVEPSSWESGCFQDLIQAFFRIGKCALLHGLFKSTVFCLRLLFRDGADPILLSLDAHRNAPGIRGIAVDVIRTDRRRQLSQNPSWVAVFLQVKIQKVFGAVERLFLGKLKRKIQLLRCLITGYCLHKQALSVMRKAGLPNAIGVSANIPCPLFTG